MATGNLGKLVIGITATTKGLQAAAKKSKGILKGISSVATSLPFVGGVAGAAASAVGLIKVADQYELAGKRLEAFTVSTAKAEQASDDLYEMSQDTGTSYLENAKALTRLQIAQKQTGLSTSQNIEVLGALNMAMQLAGTSAAEAQSTMLQLGQALGSGELMGEELRAIRENAPLVAQAIADHFGVAISGLKELGKQGELTSEEVAAALLTMSGDMATEMDKLPQTAGKAFQRIVNAAGKVWDAISDNTGFLEAVVKKLDEIAMWIQDNEKLLTQWAVDISKYIKEWIPQIQEFLGILLTGLEKAVKLANYLFSQSAEAKQKRFESGIVEEYDPANPPAANNRSASGGRSIVNNFTAAVSKNFVVDVTEQQMRNAARY